MTKETPTSTVGNRRQMLVGAALFVVAALAPFAVAIAAPWRSPAPFVAGGVLHVLALAWLIRVMGSWLRPKRNSRAADFSRAGMPLVTGTIALALVSYIAEGYGIKGSAVPRLRHATPFAADYAYLGANAAIVAMMAAAVVLLALLVRSQPWARALRNGAVATVGDVVEALFGVPAEPRNVVPATSAKDPFWRKLMGASAWVLFAICAVLSVPALWLIAADYKGELGWLVGGILLFAGVPVTVWAVLQSVWRYDKEGGVLVPAVWRSIAVPFITALPIGVLQLIVANLPVFADRIRYFQRPDEAYHGHFWFPLEDESLLRVFALEVAGGGVVFAMLAGLLVAVFLVLPILAFRDPHQFIKDSQLSRRQEDWAQNVVVARVMALGLPLAFIIPALMVGADYQDLRWWIGALLAAVGVGATYFVWRTQRVDVAARLASGQPVGILNPDDRNRLREGDDSSD